MKKRLIAILLSIFMVMTIFTTNVFATITFVTDVLETVTDGFPTTEANAWVNDNGKKLYLTEIPGNGKYFQFSSGGSLGISGQSVTPSGSNYCYSSSYYSLTFNMESEKLVSIVVDDIYFDDDGTYFPPSAFVAKIGATKYATLEGAITAALDGDTITVINDINYSDGPNLIIDNKSLTIDFDGHTIKADAGFVIPTTTNIFTVKNSGDLTINNGTIVCAGMYGGGMFAPFTVLGTGSTLTLINVKQATNLLHFLTLDGGSTTIDGGAFGSNFDSFGIVVSNNGDLTVKNNPTFTFQSALFTAGPEGNTDPDANAGSITIESGTFSGAYASEVVKLLSKATVTINGGTYTPTSTENAILTVGTHGYKSSVTINDITSNSIRMISSFNNDKLEEFAPIINGGYYKYNKGALYADRNNGLKASVSLKGGYFGPMESSNPVADDDALLELTSVCAIGYEVEELESTDPEYMNGYRYRIVKLPESPKTGVNDLLMLSSISVLALGMFIFARKKKND